MDKHGVCSFSHAVATGLVVSGVEVVRIRSTWLWVMSCWATCAALVGLDWLSCTLMLILYVFLPILIPLL